jgi:MoaA/NifB/PqqE/SkfB family radical SAM enzyme
VLRDATYYAASEAARLGVQIGFSISSNGTLIDETDGEFFEKYRLAVTICLDGPCAVHDHLRPYRGARGSFETVLRTIRPILPRQQQMQVSARVTVTPRTWDCAIRSIILSHWGFTASDFRRYSVPQVADTRCSAMISPTCSTQWWPAARSSSDVPLPEIVIRSHDREDLAAETPLIELERRLALTVEGQIRGQL